MCHLAWVELFSNRSQLIVTHQSSLFTFLFRRRTGHTFYVHQGSLSTSHWMLLMGNKPEEQILVLLQGNFLTMVVTLFPQVRFQWRYFSYSCFFFVCLSFNDGLKTELFGLFWFTVGSSFAQCILKVCSGIYFVQCALFSCQDYAP